MKENNVTNYLYENNKPSFLEKRRGYYSLMDILTYYKKFYEVIYKLMDANYSDEEKEKIFNYLKTFPIVLDNNVIVLPYSYTSIYDGSDDFRFRDISFFENGRLIAAIDLDEYKIDEFLNNEHKVTYYSDYQELYEARKKLLSAKIDEEYLPIYLIKAVDNQLFKKILDEYSSDEEIILDDAQKRIIDNEFKLIELDFKIYAEKMFALMNEKHEYSDLKGIAVLKISKEQEELAIKEQKKEELKKIIFSAFNSLNELCDSKTERFSRYTLPDNVLFKEVDGIKKIDELLLTGLKYLDLSHVVFDGVDVSNVDFTDCNPTLLNPQTIYNKDLSNTIFIEDPQRVNNVFPFGANTDFRNVNLSGAKIDIKDPILINFDGIFKDENTSIIMNGENIVENRTR